jgi:predicted RNA-binding Zn ribbon-like protein
MASRPAPTLVTPAPLAFVVEVINMWGSIPREVAGEQQTPYPLLRDLAQQHGFRLDPVTDALNDESVVQAADALYPLFDTPDAAVLVDRVNEVLDLSEVRPALTRAGDRIAEGWITKAPDRLLAACTLALHHHLLAWGDGHRLGLCEGVRCADVYADSSSAGRRRFCSTTCQNRSRVAAFRARRRSTETA